MKIPRTLFGLLVMAAGLVGCQPAATPSPVTPSSVTPSSVTPTSANTSAAAPGVVFVSVLNDMESNPQAVDMAIKFAGFALDEGRQVVIFFTVKGVRVPLRRLPADLAFGSNEPLQKQLAAVIERGAEVHVCPVCMKELAVQEADLMTGAQVTTRPKLFAKIHGNTNVFTF